jgi:uncharacterized protein YdeI (BOF family)
VNREQLERAERTARRLDRRRETAKALEEAKRWERPISLRGNRYKLKPDDQYTFTDAQLAIAMNVLERKMSAGG